MNTARVAAAKQRPPPGNPRENVELVGKLRDVECRHQLGMLSRAEYRQPLVGLRGESAKRVFDDSDERDGKGDER